jgi:hypothetical protein
MSECFITLKRTPEDLVVILSRTCYDFWKALHNDNLVELAELYSFVETPLSSVKWLPPKYKDPICQSWQALSKTHSWDADLLYHVLMILYSTAPVFPKENLRLPVLNLDTEPPLLKKTAANPRGLRAKKGRKQKPKSLPEIDLRPYLCDPKNVSTILNKLKPFWNEAVTRLRSKIILRAIADKKNIPPFTVEPHLALRHPESGKAKYTELPRKFSQHMLFWLVGQPWKKVKEFLSLYHKLGLERDETLLGAVARLLSYSKPEPTFTWLKIVSDLPSGKRYSFLLTLLETDAYDLDFSKYPSKQIRNLCAMIPYDCLEMRLQEMFLTFIQSVSIQYLEGGYRLAKKYGWNRILELQYDYPLYPAKKVESLMRWLELDTDDNLPFEIWERFGVEKNWESIILRPEWKQWPKKTVRKYIDLLDSWMDYQTSGKVKKQTFLRFLDSVDSALNSVTKDYQLGLLKNLMKFLWIWEKEGAFDKHLPRSSALMIRLSKKPIPYSNLEFHYPISWFIEHLTVSQFEQFLRASDSSFMKFDKVCQTDNKRRLLARGLYILSSELADISVNAFCCFPGKFIQVARRLGTLRFPLRHKTVNQFTRHQLLKVDLEKISPKQLFRLVNKYYQPGMTHPVPKKLQAHFKGEINLSQTRIQGYHEKVKYNFLSFILDVLDQKTRQALSQAYPVSRKNENWEHALQFFNWVDRNRRGFKNWFKAYLGGDNHYIENHPETIKWFAKHKRIDKNLWNRGILFCRKTEKRGPVRIELEKDPLEILKMGTYVGSCLSLGGHYAYSAVAVLLDLNKQVLYARDANGKVLGRQLVTISENNELVCFDVYPDNVRNDIKNLFFEYDIDFSKALNIDLYEGSEDPDQYYTIARILSQDWWDDYPWAKIAAD